MKNHSQSTRCVHFGTSGQSLFRMGFMPVLVCLLTVLGLDQSVTAAEPAAPRKGLVATVNPVATEAGLQALRDGGNAVDAAIACALTLGIVDGHNSGLGGGCFMTLRLADERLITLDGREMAPAAATRDLFLREGKADPRLSQDGALSVGIPGEFAGQVYSANEFLTRVNLMGGDKFPYLDTPVTLGKSVVVIGAGNTAMDCLRVSKRLGIPTVRCVYRRSEAEAPARIAENSISSSAYEVSMITLMFGCLSTICSQASMPEVPDSSLTSAS